VLRASPFGLEILYYEMKDRPRTFQASEWLSVHAEVRKRPKKHVAAKEGSKGGSAKGKEASGLSF